MIDRLSAVAGRNVPRETFARLELYVDRLLAANRVQNLIARSTEAEVWQRHILDAAQLVRFAPRRDSSWLDIGSGAGLPGMVVAILSDGPVALVEPRRLRAAFLAETAEDLAIADRVQVIAAKVETVSGRFDVITARAVATLDRLFDLSLRLGHRSTLWVLPRGRNGKSELAEASGKWQGEFRTEPSRTDSDAVIVLATALAKRGGE